MGVDKGALSGQVEDIRLRLPDRDGSLGICVGGHRPWLEPHQETGRPSGWAVDGYGLGVSWGLQQQETHPWVCGPHPLTHQGISPSRNHNQRATLTPSIPKSV